MRLYSVLSAHQTACIACMDPESLRWTVQSVAVDPEGRLNYEARQPCTQFNLYRMYVEGQ